MAFSGTLDGSEDFQDDRSAVAGGPKKPPGPKTGKTTTPLGQEAMDSLRHDFLEDLDSASFAVTEWENGFLESNLSRTKFSEGQRKIIDKLRRKYENKL